MNYLLNGSKAVVGVAALVLWWLALNFFGRRNRDKTLGSLAFATLPAFFLVWFVAACMLILDAIGWV